MFELMKDHVGWLFLAAWSVLAAMHPHAASGALAGCAFFLTTPNAATGFKRVLLLIFSFLVGYAGGLFFYGDGPPYSPKAMLVSAGFSAVAVVVFTAATHMFEHNGDLPPWFKSVAKFLTGKGSENG